MAGPSASILLAKPADPTRVAALVEDHFETMEMSGKDPPAAPAPAFNGLIARRPFIIHCGMEYEERLEDLDLQSIQQALGWAPVNEIRIAAMGNSPEDPALLARVCALIAEHLDGIVDLGGKPWNLSDDEVARIPGRLLVLRSFDAGEPLSDELTQCYCDAAFLKNWAKHPQFQMIK